MAQVIFSVGFGFFYFMTSYIFFAVVFFEICLLISFWFFLLYQKNFLKSIYMGLYFICWLISFLIVEKSNKVMNKKK